MIYLCNSQVRKQTNVKREDEDWEKERQRNSKQPEAEDKSHTGDNYKMGGSKGPEFGKEEEEQTDAV